MEALTSAPATMALLAANIIVSLIGFSNREMFEQNAFWIAPIRQGKQWYRFVTAGFLHVNQLHLIINMYVLYSFGTLLESKVLGTQGFLLVYFASLLGGSAWEYVTKKDQPNYRAVGASGATSGTILAFSLFFPFATLLLFFVIPMPAIVLAIGFIGVAWLSPSPCAPKPWAVCLSSSPDYWVSRPRSIHPLFQGASRLGFL